MGDGALFGDVRAVVHGSSTHIAWADLCLLLENTDPKTYRARLEPYLLDTLSSWPDEVRVAPIRWLSAACRGEDVPWLGLARHLHVSEEVLRACATSTTGHGRNGPEPTGLRALVALEDLDGVCELSVAGKWDQHGLFYTLCDAPVFEGVRTLRLYTSTSSNDPFAYQDFHGSVLARGLERLDVVFNTYRGHDSFARWCEGIAGGSVPSLEALSLHSPGDGGEEYMEALFASSSLDAVKSFGWHSPNLTYRPIEILDGALPNLERLDIRFRRTWGVTSSDGNDFVEVIEALDPSRLRALTLANVWIADDPIVRLLDAIGPGNPLEELRLIRCGLSDFEVEKIAEFGGWGSLRALDLGGNEEIGASAAKAFLNTLDAPSLEALSLCDVGINEKSGIDGLARFTQLRELDLSGKNTLRASGAEVVGSLPNLEFAVLERAGINGAGMAPLASGAARESLRYLDLRSNRLGRVGIEALVESELRPEVLYLGRDMVSNDLDRSCMELLAEWEGLSGVRVLSVSNSRLKQKDLMVLLRSEHLSGVEFLDLSKNSLGKAGAAALAECAHLSNLRGLGIAACGLKKGGFTAFCGIDFMRKLTYLSLGGNGIEPELYEELWLDAQVNFPALEWFDGGWGARDMGAAFPYAQLDRYSKHTSSRWIAPWMLPTNTTQPEFLSEWGA